MPFSRWAPNAQNIHSYSIVSNGPDYLFISGRCSALRPVTHLLAYWGNPHSRYTELALFAYTVNDKVYIGQTTMTVHERFMVHMKPSTAKLRRNYKLYNAVTKYGRDKFYVETLEAGIPLELLNRKEIEYIAAYNSFYDGYNSTKGGDGRIINKVENEDELLSLAKSGMPADELALKFSVNKATVLRTLHKLGFYYHVSQDAILRLARSGMSNTKIAQSLGCHTATVCRALDKADARKHRVPIKNRDDLNISAIVDAYNAQMPMQELCNKFGITKTVFYRIKKSINLKSRPQIYKHKIRYHD